MIDYAARRDRLRERMAAGQCPALLITNLPDVRYLCGFGPNAALLVLTDGQILATDGRYVVQAEHDAPGWTWPSLPAGARSARCGRRTGTLFGSASMRSR
ncbi:MAG: aminopeptidase P family N-terminal domain-containing protein [Candidatus Nanopelagicales bacterium]